MPANPFKFGTKAETLKSLSTRVSARLVPPFTYFSVEDWRRSPDSILKRIQFRFRRNQLIVRSSARDEDQNHSSMAGFYDSILHVSASDRTTLQESIDRVIRSYARSSHASARRHQVVVQVMIENISMSGVVFTQDMNTGAPYYVINYDDQTGRTDTVTAGTQHSNRTLLVHRSAVHELSSKRFKALLRIIQKVEKATGLDSLDIEFAVDPQNQVHLFQVRPIAVRPNWNLKITGRVNDAIRGIKTFVADHQREVPGIYGRRSVFGTMPDWNPAEMIGTTPRPLALSLYRTLITDFAWREARRQMGYEEPHGARLLVDLCGKPYVDVRLSFHSFLPHGLEPAIARKLVNAWLRRLSANKELHDKIEFDVAITALAFDFETSVRRQIPGVLSPREKASYREALRNLTDDLISGKRTAIDSELKKIHTLAERRSRLMELRRKPEIPVVSALLEDCIFHGTIPFSILARHAFIAKSFMRSMIRRGVLSEDESLQFQKSIRTVATRFVTDIDRVSRNKMSLEQFMEIYGHLRPGTYDILSLRYDQRQDLLKGALKPASREETCTPFRFSAKQLRQIDRLLRGFGFKATAAGLIDYIRQATAAREFAKFVFTKNVSDALEIIAAWGKRVGLGREELSYLRIEDILESANVAQGQTHAEHLRRLAAEGKQFHDVAQAIRLPYLIERPEDVAIVPLLIHKPNFITQKTVRGRYLFIDGKSDRIPDLKGRIVMIESADPGCDWIFSRPILGLVTKFGGANSHMAIRCAEFGLPAAIGCGEQIFDRILRCQAIELNCSEERIEPVEV